MNSIGSVIPATIAVSVTGISDPATSFSFPFGCDIKRQGDARNAEDFRVAVERESALREELLQRFCALRIFAEMLCPIRDDPAFRYSRPVNKRRVNKVMKAGRNQNPFKNV